MVRFLFATPAAEETARRLLPDTPLYAVSDRTRGVFATEHSQGIGAVVDFPRHCDVTQCAAATTPLFHLEAIADPGNLGTIVRTADWFGFAALSLGPGSVDPYNPKAVRATMGSIFRVSLFLGTTYKDLCALERPLIALDAHGADVRTAQLPRNGVYVVGSEAHGISDDIRSVAALVSITRAGGGESLNAAMAAAFLMYELQGRR